MNKDLDNLLLHSQGKVIRYLSQTKRSSNNNYSFLPTYNSFQNTLYYELLQSLDINQLKNFYVSLFCKWKKIKNDLDEEHPNHKYKDKILIPYKDIKICELNGILTEFIDNQKILGIFVINMVQRGVIP